jgi:acyl carrier protein
MEVILMFEKVRAIIADKLSLNEDEITMDSTFEDLGADSLDIVELVMALEEEFDVEIADEQAENAKKVGDVVNYLKTLTGED